MGAGHRARLLLLLFSSNSFFEVSPTPKDGAKCSLGLPGGRGAGGPRHPPGAGRGTQGQVGRPGPLLARGSVSAWEPAASQATVVWG